MVPFQICPQSIALWPLLSTSYFLPLTSLLTSPCSFSLSSNQAPGTQTPPIANANSVAIPIFRTKMKNQFSANQSSSSMNALIKENLWKVIFILVLNKRGGEPCTIGWNFCWTQDKSFMRILQTHREKIENVQDYAERKCRSRTWTKSGQKSYYLNRMENLQPFV